MKFVETKLKGCYVLEPEIYKDNRGYFFESFNQAKFETAIGKPINFVQDNQSFSSKGVLRGLHFQKGKYAQAKLVRVLEGEVLDVVVDVRTESPTFGKHFSILLSSENKKQLFIPRDFAHGFVVLSNQAHFFYKCDNFYNKDSESGLIYNDKDLGINWIYQERELKISEKDMELPRFKNLKL
ncbi:MAG: dTDP-4-dehydrorhamnose 3,5-epimerase [Bacteroidota bacterium]